MSLRHKSLAEVWQHLQGRHDIASVLREIIGQHSIESTLLEDESRKTEESIRTVIWIKTIFDLQRCYLGGNATGVSDCPPYVLSCLLPSELLFSTIIYLINVKQRLFSSQTTLMTREFTRPRHILAQTLLSGLRLLLLRKEKITPQEARRLQTAINTSWKDDRLHGVERFVVSGLFAAVLDAVNETARDNPYRTEWTNARLPTYAAGLYPLDIRPETFVTSLIHGTMEEDWIEAYWVLFDTLWAVECAVTQRYVDIRRQTGVFGFNQIGVDTDETLEQLYQTRASLIISIFRITGPMTPTPALLDSLAITLLDWSEDLDSFLSRQDSLIPQRSSLRPSRAPNYGKNVLELSPYFEAALKSFAEWLSSHKSGYEQFSIRKSGVTADDMSEMVKEWITRMTSSNVETQTWDLEGPFLPVYIVDCPKLHVIPKKFLAYKLRWLDKWAYEAIQENSPIVNWKEGVQCPSCCTSGEKIKYARLIEPFQHLSTALENFHFDDYSLSQYSVGDSGSYDAASASLASRSASDVESLGVSLPSQSTMNVSGSSHVSRPSGDDVITDASGHPPRYSESPISPLTQPTHSYGSLPFEHPVSPLNESLNIPIPLISVGSRLSMDLPIPVLIPSIPERIIPESIPESIPEHFSASAPSDVSSIRLNTPSTDSMWSGASVAKSKSPSRTVRLAKSIRRKPTTKEKETYPLPKDPCFLFSTSGHSLLLWGKGADFLIRFDVPSNDTSAIQGCKYDIPSIEVAAAGNHKCAIIAASGLLKRKLAIYNGINLTPEHEIDLEFSGRLGEICLAVSRNDKFVATSINDQIQIFSLDDGIQNLAFHHQIHVYELRGGVQHRRTIPIGRTSSDESVIEPQRGETSWFGPPSKGLSSKEVAEEQQRQSAIISRKLYFSTDSKRLVVATQLGDHCVYVDVWDCTREPVSTISEHSRSFKLPPWTLNDGDLTSVFYDTSRRSAIVTAFLGKEYPVLIPFPGYDTLQNEQYSTKVVHAAQSPSGTSFVVANAMTEIIQFEYTAKGTLSPRKLKKSSGKISNSVFKPGAIAIAMPLENCLQCFWIKDGKCMLRSIKIGTGETFRDYDIRAHYDRLMSLKNKPIITRAPSLMIPELDAGGFD
ncbi:hypothetical protein K505DRAFT_359320 [Melanomma pulvis-pyrius CBS 109.77]|uniref:WD40 repeat-like protein n=1 Tax=Melanomma pulvis-pyrius CBS 109.77 TaxID=1314802 RepID=A0A6A6XK33_9PLEO|nr:hypothetical protein K505DRAFT_359320 [Melanomma pulvis-pyrius CBS 109.77]